MLGEKDEIEVTIKKTSLANLSKVMHERQSVNKQKKKNLLVNYALRLMFELQLFFLVNFNARTLPEP